MAAAGAGPGSAPVLRRAAPAPPGVQCCSAAIAALARSWRKGRVKVVARTAKIAVLDR